MHGDSSPLFTDLYQWTMAAAYWKSGKAKQRACFEMFFRECPFGGEYAIMAGLDRVKEILDHFRLDDQDREFLEGLPGFSSALLREIQKQMNLEGVCVRAIPEGSPIFPREPLLQVEGPLFKVQLLESALLNAVNFASLCATYACRIRQVAGERQLVEFGLRRAQGPNGAMTASRASYVGGFDGTSNILAAQKWNIPCYGTMAHSFVQSFTHLQPEDLSWNNTDLRSFLSDDLRPGHRGELAAFIQFAKSQPESCLLLVDTYDTLGSGVPNAIRVFKMLRHFGYSPRGIRLDSGDLVYQSVEARKMMNEAGFSDALIFASNDLSESIISSLQQQGAQINSYGVGTQLVTCMEQPALGGVYKLVEIDGQARLKISEQTNKISIPGKKEIYRLMGKDGTLLLDLLQLSGEPAPQAGQNLTAYHPFDPLKRVQISPAQVRPLLATVFEDNQWIYPLDLEQARERCATEVQALRADIRRRDFPTPYKVSLSEKLKKKFDQCLAEEAPFRHLA